MELLKLRNDYTPVPVGFSDGVLPTSCTMQWAQPPRRNGNGDNLVEIVYALAQGDALANLDEFALERTGWYSPHATKLKMAIAPFLSANAASCFLWNTPVDRLCLISREARPSARLLLKELHEAGPKKVSSDLLYKNLETLLHLISLNEFGEIDWMFENAQINLIAPEVLVGMVRATCNNTGSLVSWAPFLSKVADELSRRGFDAASVLDGLLEDPISRAEQT